MAQATTVSLKQKIGQMLILGFEGKAANENSSIAHSIIEDNLGGVILFDYNYQTKTFDKNIESPQQVQLLNQTLQAFASKGNQKHHRPQLPLLISVDYEGGAVNRLKPEYGFPTTLTAEAVANLDREVASQQAKIMSDTLKASGFNLDFAPVLDVNVNPDNPVIGKLGRSYSSDPHIVSDYSLMFSQQLLKNNIACAYKHFPGHGSSTKDSHLGFVDVTDTWQSYELTPYENVFQDGSACPMIMTAHIINRHLDPDGLPATLSKPILTELLRNKLGYQGVIITDDMQMKAISEHYGLEESLVMAINAGADMFIFGNQLSDEPVSANTLIQLILKNVENGKISSQQIEQAYERIQQLKRSTYLS